MKKTKNPSLTKERAIALLVHMEYLPAGTVLEEMTEAFLNIAEIELDNGKIDKLPSNEIRKLELRYEICWVRHNMTQHLMKCFDEEIQSEDSMLVSAGSKSDEPLYTQESVSDWAGERFGMYVPQEDPETPRRKKSVKWEDVTIKIYKNNMIGYFNKEKNFKRISFRDIGLMAKNKYQPNKVGMVLIALSTGRKYPPGGNPQPKEKTAISKLRDALKRLTGIKDDPFAPVNPSDGWIPRFNLFDDRRNADERAKQKATHVSMNNFETESKDFDDEDDPAAAFLRNHRG